MISIRRSAPLGLVGLLLAGSAVLGAAPARADGYVPVAGSGSSWAANAMSDWTNNVKKYGWQVTYDGAAGSSKGRADFLNHTNDFSVSDIPFQTRPTDGTAPENPAPNSYAYMPIVAGGTSFMYNLTISGKRVTNLRLSDANIAKIFTGVITKWNDPAIQTDNPGLIMPAVSVVPVVRSDGSGSSAQFSLWMVNQQPAIWNAYYQRLGKGSTGGETSFWPTVKGMIGQSGDTGVAGYITQASYGNGTIGYVQYSYAKNAHFPVAKMLNKAGYYVEPTPDNVAVALLQARINDNPDPAVYLTQDLTGVYSDADPRSYPLSSYSYMILPTTVQGKFSVDKGRTLGAFAYYLTCQGQQDAPELGYSPLPINLADAAFEQIRKIPGVDAQAVNVATCNNPTFTADGHNALVDQAPQPQACDRQGPTQCATGTGGATASTPVRPGATATGKASVAATGTAATAGGSAVGGGGDDAATTVDPDTGLAAGGNATAALPLSAPVSLRGDAGGWTGAQTLAVLAIALLAAVFLLPPLLVRRLSGRGRS